MAKSAQSLHRHQIACFRTAVAQAVEGRDASAEDRRCLHRRECVWNCSHGFAPGNHVLGIPAIFLESRDLKVLTAHEIPTATGDTLSTMSAVPPHADPLALLPNCHTRSNGIDHTGDLVPRHSWVLQARPVPLLHKEVTMTDATGLYLDADGMRPRFRHLAIHCLERAARTAHLHCNHL